MKKIFFKINSINSRFVNYGFFTRNGGYSKKNFKSLNCSYASNDIKRYVKKNILTAIKKLNLDNKKLILVKQSHSTKIIHINSKNYNKKHSADGIITKNREIAIGVLTADCAPIFIFDKKKEIICCLHSGWKGTLNNIVKNGVKSISKNKIKRDDLIVIIGPCLSKKNFEVNSDFKNQFIRKNSKYSEFFKFKNSGKDLFDMRGIINFQFKDLGINNVYNIKKDTYSNKSMFFSYRRSKHIDELNTGRMINIIGFK